MRKTTWTALAVVILIAAGFAAASIASGSGALSSDTTVTTATTAVRTVTSTVPSAVTVPAGSRKVTICHYTRSRRHPFVTIKVGANAVFAHFRHHDLPGPCTTKTVKRILKSIRAAKAHARHRT